MPPNREVEAIPTLRAVAHVAVGADEGSELLLAWLGRSGAPLASIANSPGAAYDVLETFDRHWPAIAASAGLRQEAEGRVMDIVHAACRPPAEAKEPGQWLHAVLLWLWNLPSKGPVQRCWTNEQQDTLEQLLNGFQEVGYKDALQAHLAQSERRQHRL